MYFGLSVGFNRASLELSAAAYGKKTVSVSSRPTFYFSEVCMLHVMKKRYFPLRQKTFHEKSFTLLFFFG